MNVSDLSKKNFQEKPYERKAVMREWDVGKNDKDKDKIRRQDERPIGLDKRRHRTPERSPEPGLVFLTFCTLVVLHLVDNRLCKLNIHHYLLYLELLKRLISTIA